MRSYRDRAIVLRTYKLGEADRILVLLTRGSGTVRAVAKGVRKTSSKFGARLEPFSVVDLQLYQGRNLDTVTQAETVANYARQLGEDYEKYAGAHVMVEVADRLTADEQNTAAHFQLLYGALAALAKGERPWRMVVASYLLRVLGLAGWAPSTTVCAICNRDSDLSRFNYQQGGAVCENCALPGSQKVSPGVLELLGLLSCPEWRVVPELVEYEVQSLSVVTGFAQYHVEHNLKAVPIMERGAYG